MPEIGVEYSKLPFQQSVPDPAITSAELNALDDQAQVDIVKPYLEEFTDELIKANRSWDYRTLSRRITGIASLYNNVVSISLCDRGKDYNSDPFDSPLWLNGKVPDTRPK